MAGRMLLLLGLRWLRWLLLWVVPVVRRWPVVAAAMVTAVVDDRSSRSTAAAVAAAVAVVAAVRICHSTPAAAALAVVAAVRSHSTPAAAGTAAAAALVPAVTRSCGLRSLRSLRSRHCRRSRRSRRSRSSRCPWPQPWRLCWPVHRSASMAVAGRPPQRSSTGGVSYTSDIVWMPRHTPVLPLPPPASAGGLVR